MRWALVVFLGAIAFACSSGSDEGSVSNDTGGQPNVGGSGASGGSGGSGASSIGGGGGLPSYDAGPDVLVQPDSGTGGTTEAGPTGEVLLDQPGVVFVPTEAETLKKIFLGENGTVYQTVRVEFDLLAAGWQPEVPDEGNPDRTEHILFGFFRDHQTKSDQRYLMGSAAVTWPTKGPHFRMFGRLSIGAGYQTYTQWSSSYGWSEGTQYHVDCLLDGVQKTQHCALLVGGNIEKELAGDVAYLVPAEHLSTGFYLELGRAPTGEIETSPIGWTYSNLLVTATK